MMRKSRRPSDPAARVDVALANAASNRLYQSVAAELIGAIRAGRYRVGHRLPAERDLAQEFGVSRPTVREAIIALEVQGLVEVRLGSGVYVRRPPQRHDAPGDGVGAFELTEARLLIEGESAALATSHMGEAEMDRLDVLVEAIAAANEQGAGEEPDREFHLAIARGTGNGAIVKTVATLWALRQTSAECALMLARARSGGSKPVVEEHRHIVAALRTRDPLRARVAMRAHLNAVLQHLLETTEADAVERARAEMAVTRLRFERSAEV